MSLYHIEGNGVGIPEKRLDPGGSIPGEVPGLTIAHRILNRNKGRISVESELGKGTTFTIALPTAIPIPQKAGRRH